MEPVLKILILCSGNKGRINPFIAEQVEAIKEYRVQVHYFLINGKGILGYMKSYIRFLKIIKKEKYNLVHAHYGLSGLLGVLQWRVPVIITFHGSDVNQKKTRWLSRLASRFARHNILVEKSFADKLRIRNRYSVIPCGIELKTFIPIEKTMARANMNLLQDVPLVLFSSSFTNPVKNYPLARAAVEKLDGVRLMELKNYSRTEINLLMNAADALLLTSFNEGSPQVVKEAMACNLPVVATPVGDINELFQDCEGNYIVTYDADRIASTLNHVLQSKNRTGARKKILPMDNAQVAEKIVLLYRAVIRQD